MALKTYDRHSAAVIRSPRWKFLRKVAKDRDGWKCVKCEYRGRLEVDHIKSVRDAPELAFDLDNLQSLCRRCHSRKTRIECGLAVELEPKRQAWRDLVRALAQPKQKEVLHVDQC